MPRSTHNNPLRRVVAAVAAALVPAGSALAQADAPDGASIPSNQTLACVRALPDSAYRRSVVFVYAEVSDSADAAARPAVDLAAQVVGTRVRAALWPTPAAAASADAAGRLPAIDSVVGRVYPEGTLRVVVRRGGRATWRVDAPAGADSAPVGLVERALRAAHAAGEVFVVDELLRGDSLAFELGFAYARRAAPGERPDTLRVRNPTPVFTALMPEERQAAARPGTFRVRYPAALQAKNLEGRVVLEFVIDTAGRAEAGTVRDANPSTLAALAPKLRPAYGEFVRAARDAVLGARFYPAEIGGCRVRQLVQLPLAWTLNR